MPPPTSTDLARACDAWPELRGGAASPLGRGLINETYRVVAPAGDFVLQRVSPIFAPAVNDNVRAVTAHLARKGLVTPRLVVAPDGRSWVELGAGGVWRLLTFVAGASFDTARSAAQAKAAGALAGRFHAALSDLDYTFTGLREGVHDLLRHGAALAAALERHPDHRLHPAVAALAGPLLEAAASLPAPDGLVTVVGHGDLKLNNVRFAGQAAPDRDRAVCLIDLDTVGPIPLQFELGDAWRSWCNPSGEDGARAVVFDMELCAASYAGYLEGRGRALAVDERQQLLDGVERISTELATRFATDALEESYFGWDPARHPGRGEHNLHRARIQWQLAVSARDSRSERAEMLGITYAR